MNGGEERVFVRGSGASWRGDEERVCVGLPLPISWMQEYESMARTINPVSVGRKDIFFNIGGPWSSSQRFIIQYLIYLVFFLFSKPSLISS